MLEMNDNLVIAIVCGGVVSGVIVRVLSFILKSRCRKIRCCGCIECEREVISETNLSRATIREIPVPNSVINKN